MTEFLLLGTVEVRGADGTAVDPGPAKRRAVLAALLVDTGRWVTVETLVDRVWGEAVPARVRPSLYAHIARIRLSLADAAPAAEGLRLRRGPGGYLLDVPPEQVDLHRFRYVVERARTAGCTDAERAETLRQALGWWRGEPLAGLTGTWAEHTRESWRQERVEAVLGWADAEHRTGRPTGVIGALTALAAEHPLVEPLTVALMRALAAAGRSPEALTRYAALRNHLAEELGTDPGTEARQIHQALLRGEPLPPPPHGTRPSDPGTPLPGPGTWLPGSGAVPPGPGVPPPGSGTLPSGPGTPLPGPGTPLPGSGVLPPGPGVLPSGSGSTLPGPGVPEPGSGTSLPGSGVLPPGPGVPSGSGSPPPIPGTPLPGSDCALPGSGTPQPGSGAVPSGSGSPPPIPGMPPPGSDTLPSGPGTPQSGSGAVSPGPGMLPPGSGAPLPGLSTPPSIPGAPPSDSGALPSGSGSSLPGPGAQLPGSDAQLPGSGALPSGPATSLAVPATPPAVPTLLPPAQLPLAARGFTGRERELARLDGILAAADRRPTAVVVSAVSGTAGIGKTALAVHWAHRVADRFPDGQLYVNLRGFDPSGVALAPEQAVRDFVGALGGPAQHVPAGLQARAGLYRSLLAGRRVLVVLDNARDADQVRPLLPGSPGCLAVVTSRNRLTGLVAAEGAHPIALDLLSPVEARALLGRRLGEERVAAEPDAVREIITRCARLPLALAIATARAAAHPGFPLGAVAEELRDNRGSLDAFDGGDLATDVRAVFSWSHDALTPVQARLFALLGLAPGPDIELFALASLAGLPGSVTRAAVRALENLHLVEEAEPGRWRMHDLVRLYAADRGRQDLATEEREAALRRLTGFYLHTVSGSLRVMPLDDVPPDLGEPEPGCRPRPLTSQAQALRWLTRELPNLLAAQRLATERGWRRSVWQFAWSLDQFYGLLGQVHDRVAMWRAALDALGPDDPPDVHLRVHRRLGHASTHVGAYDEAREHLAHALALAEQAGDRGAQARIHIALAQAYGQQDRLRPALAHSHRALRALPESELPALKAAAFNAAGWYKARLGRYAPARAHCEAALPLARRAGHESIEADILDSLGYIAHHTGRHREAVDHYRLAVARYRGSGSDRWVADTLDRLGHTYEALGLPAEARAVWEEAAAMYADQHRPVPEERVREQLARLG
ncbi:BTAD domain-containing putative transcriptional regulator [Streptomyces sp. 4F14]|uniref:AfsR/SARP family transcriptional regulator n=1 Tax=Streptomyces sp. 4F14 TaxID=3394380 RepID=UPI003A87D9EB